MRITILAFGTRGDVQPVLALGKAMQQQGHQVRLVTSTDFTAWVESHGLEPADAGVAVQALMRSERGLEWIEHGNHTVRQLRVMKKLLDEHGPVMMLAAWEFSQDAEAIISSFTSDIYAVSIAERLRARHISAALQPAVVATRSGMATQQAPLPNRLSIVNYLFGKLLLEPTGWRLIGPMTNRFRRQALDLPPQTGRDNRRALRCVPIVQGFSRHVVPHPPDWPPYIHTTGYWFLEQGSSWQASPELLTFLEAGEAPVYVGFGSMTGRDPAGMTRLIAGALHESGHRAVLQSGWAGIGQAGLPEQVFVLDEAPHSWLFPRMRAVVHHGGAGSTAESVRAGVPTVIVPHMADQPFWGARIAALGVGPHPIPRNKLTVESLAAAIRQAGSDLEMRERAASLGAKVRAEDGVGLAAGLIEQYLERPG